MLTEEQRIEENPSPDLQDIAERKADSILNKNEDKFVTAGAILDGSFYES